MWQQRNTENANASFKSNFIIFPYQNTGFGFGLLAYWLSILDCSIAFEINYLIDLIILHLNWLSSKITTYVDEKNAYV